MKIISTPITDEIIKELNPGDMIYITGKIYTGRDAVLPKIVQMIQDGSLKDAAFDLRGSVIFHTAVSVAGVGPTSSNKYEIESSIPVLSENGVKLHLGKGQLSEKTVEALNEHNSVYAVIPPVTALLESKTLSRKIIAFPELGMEAFYELEVKEYPAIIAAVSGKSIYDK